MSNIFPQPIKLDAADAAKLRAINDRLAAIQTWVQTVQGQAERRIAELKNDGREVWAVLQAKYNLDLDRVSYDLDNTGETIIPLGIRLQK